MNMRPVHEDLGAANFGRQGTGTCRRETHGEDTAGHVCISESQLSATWPHACMCHRSHPERRVQVSENNESVFYFSRACIIDELEASLPSWFRGIWADSWYPAYVHYLQVRSSCPMLQPERQALQRP